MLGIWGYHDTAIEVCREALAEAEAIDPAQVDQVEVELAGNAVVSPAAAAEGLTLIAAHADDPAASSSWRIMAAFADTVIGRPADDALSRVGPVLAGQLGPPAPDSLIPVYLVLALVWNDALIPARAACDAVIDAAQLRGSMSAVAHASCVRSIIAHRCGQLDDAINDGRLALEFKLKTSPPAAVVWAAAFCIEAFTEQGNLEEADAIAEEACAREPPEDWVHTVTFLQARGALRAAQGRFEEALDDLQTAGTGMRGLGIEHPGAAIWRAHAALAHLAIGQPDQAARLAAEQLDLARRVGTDRLLGIALRISAATAGDERAESSLTEAVSLLERTPARLELAHALADLGALRRRAGRRSEARDPLLKARELADRAGAAALAARAHAELLAAGARPRRAALSGPDALTAAERRVAALATQGLTNRQIAQRLFITQPTVETHLRHTFQKLDITSRSEISPRLRGA
jgi:DNA-binding CsgD family transcriptional regulator